MSRHEGDAGPGVWPDGLLAAADREARPFDEPWQAQAFALTIALHERGLFDWSEWARRLSRELACPGVSDDGSDYYACWLRALERALAEKGLAAASEVEDMAEAWHRAARATPHGKPIVL